MLLSLKAEEGFYFELRSWVRSGWGMKLQTWIEEVKEKGKEAQSPCEKLGDGNEMRWGSWVVT